MIYPAFLGVPEPPKKDDGEKYQKREREAIEWETMQEVLKHWDTHTKVEPYPDHFTNPDEIWRRMKRNERKGKMPYQALNEYGKSRGLQFYREPPEEYKDIDTRTPARTTGLLCYSTLNPDGMFDSYTFPIEHSYNGISVESSKLVNKNYGTNHDMLFVNELDWDDATLLPEIGFMAYKDEDGEWQYDVIECDDEMNHSEWAQRLYDFYFDKLGLYGMIAIIECEM